MISEKKLNAESHNKDLGLVFYCIDNNEKQFKVTFDSGSLKKDDVWYLCDECNSKPEFQNHRISMEKIHC